MIRILMLLCCLVWADMSHADMQCIPLDSSLDLGVISAASRYKRMSIVLRARCENLSEAAQAGQLILTFDENRSLVLETPTGGAAVPMIIRGGHSAPSGEPRTAVCQPVRLAARETRVFSFPLELVLNLKAARGGSYAASIPFTVSFYDQQDGEKRLCAPVF